MGVRRAVVLLFPNGAASAGGTGTEPATVLAAGAGHPPAMRGAQFFACVSCSSARPDQPQQISRLKKVVQLTAITDQAGDSSSFGDRADDAVPQPSRRSQRRQAERARGNAPRRGLCLAADLAVGSLPQDGGGAGLAPAGFSGWPMARNRRRSRSGCAGECQQRQQRKPAMLLLSSSMIDELGSAARRRSLVAACSQGVEERRRVRARLFARRRRRPVEPASSVLLISPARVLSMPSTVAAGASRCVPGAGGRWRDARRTGRGCRWPRRWAGCSCRAAVAGDDAHRVDAAVAVRSSPRFVHR